MALGIGSAGPRVNDLDEPGSLPVFPLIDSIDHTSIIDIARHDRPPLRDPSWGLNGKVTVREK